MKRTFLIAVIVLISVSTRAQKAGQEFIDSLLTELPKAKEDTGKVKLLNSLANPFVNVNEYDTALHYCNTSAALAEKLHFKKGQGDAYNIMGNVAAGKGDHSGAVNNYEMALKVREEMGDKKGMAAAYNSMGIAFANQNKFPESLKMFFAALKINEETNNKMWLANNYDNIGLVYQAQGNYPAALKMSFAALKIYELINDKNNMAMCYNNIGLLYWTQKDYSGALDIYSKSLKMLGEAGDRANMNDPYNNMAGIYADMGNYTEALKNYTISLKIREQMGDKNSIADSHGGIGVVYQKMSKYTEALSQFGEALKLYEELDNQYGVAGIYASYGEISMALKEFGEARSFFDKAIELYKEVSDPSQFSYIFKDLATMDSAAGNYKSALENYQLYILYRDSSVNQENSKKLVQTQMQYDFDKEQDSTKAAQEKKDIVTQAEIKKQKLIRNSVTGGLAVVMVFAIVFFIQRKRISKARKRSDELLLNILPSETAEELKATGSAEAKDFDLVTVMFTDFKNFTQASEQMNAKDLVKEINHYFSEFDRIISKYNIEKIKTIGDSYMCAGGLPVPNQSHATDVVHAALEIQQFMKQQKGDRQSFEIRIGIHTGPVVAGIVGIKKFAYDIWGDTVNIASRMESSGEAGKVNISGATYELVKDQFPCTYRGKIEAKHKGEIDMYFIERPN